MKSLKNLKTRWHRFSLNQTNNDQIILVAMKAVILMDAMVHRLSNNHDLNQNRGLKSKENILGILKNIFLHGFSNFIIYLGYNPTANREDLLIFK
ncbi:MAG: hypothetical protein M1480_13450 [Bacteroidetes bacterium]|nr:hypothetical protein [Bacteroidota bacterium]